MTKILFGDFTSRLVFDLICELRLKASNFLNVIVFVLLELLDEVFNSELDHVK